MKYIILNVFLCILCIVSIGITKEIIQTKPKEKIIVIKKIKKVYHSYIVTITAYSPSENETDSTPNQTAILEKPIPGKTCAVSRDLVDYLGKKVYITGYGVFEVNDLMNKKYKRRIDICMGKRNAIKFGKKENVKIVFF
jgi:3D (Asp-Asp-Asp) domain-containing protein